MKKSRKLVKKSRKLVKKSRKPIKKSRKPIKKSRKRRSRKRSHKKQSRSHKKQSRSRKKQSRSRKKQSRSRKNKFKMFESLQSLGTGRMGKSWYDDEAAIALSKMKKYRHRPVRGKGRLSLEERKQYRRRLLHGPGLRSAPLTASVIEGETLPLPLRILRKGRLFDITPSINYPRDPKTGNIDETHDIFWPETEEALKHFLSYYPTDEELSYFVK